MKETRRTFLKQSMQTGAGVFLSSLSCRPFAKPRRPNVILIFPDQMRAHAMGCSGNPDVQTPHLDKLAKQGALLNTFSNTPVCGPARACMLTGQYTHQHGVVTNDLRLREDHVTLAEAYKNHGYQTGFVGKWHLDGGPKQPGFVPLERRQGFDFWAANECSHQHFDSHYFKGNSQIPVPINRFEPEIWFDEALSFIEEVKKNPFFLTIAVGPPHNPYKAPSSYEAFYDADTLKMPQNWQSVPAGEKKDLASYYAMITAIDDQIGRLMNRLHDLNMSENTLILFISDHGDMLGSQGRIYKRQPWEESIKVPGILHWPKKIKSQKPAGLFSTVDVAPTLLDLCEIPIPESMTGKSVKAMLMGKDDGPDAAFFQIMGPCAWQQVPAGWRGIRTRRYMYARFEDKPWVLYDLQTDPGEMNNCVNLPDYAEVEKELDARLSQWMADQGDAWELNWTEPFADHFELSKHRAFESIDAYFKWKLNQAF